MKSKIPKTRWSLKSVLVKIGASLLIAGSIALFAAPAAQAAPTHTTTITVSSAVHSANSICGTAPTAGNEQASTSDFLPVNRWIGSSSKMHTLLTSGLDIQAITDAARRNAVEGGVLGVSNSIMGVTSGVTTMAITFCPMVQAGGLIDREQMIESIVNSQPRVPERVSSDGGKWVTAHPEEPAPMKLYDRGTGTCFNPPMATTAAKALEFWEHVDIPDITIQRARLLCNEQKRVDFAAHI
jgi:hypothetical protein